MKTLTAFAVPACALALMALPESSQAVYPTRPYEASWESQGPSGKVYATRFATDGKGRGRSEMPGAGGNMRAAIADLKAKTVYVLLPEQKMALKLPLKEEEMLGMTESLSPNKGKDLGVKVIDGHPCHGRLHDLGGTVAEIWTGDDIQVPVYSITTMSGYGKTVRRLKSYQPTAPAAHAFVVPPSFRVVDGARGM